MAGPEQRREFEAFARAVREATQPDRPHLLALVGSAASDFTREPRDLDLLLVLEGGGTSPVRGYSRLPEVQDRLLAAIKHWHAESSFANRKLFFSPEFRLEPFTRLLSGSFGGDRLVVHLLLYPSWDAFLAWEHPSVARGLLLSGGDRPCLLYRGEVPEPGFVPASLLSKLPAYDSKAALEHLYRQLWLVHSYIAANWQEGPEVLAAVGRHFLDYTIRFSFAHLAKLEICSAAEVDAALRGEAETAAGRALVAAMNHSGPLASVARELRASPTGASDTDIRDAAVRVLKAIAPHIET